MEFNRQPFQYDVDTAFFFPGGERGDIVDDIKTALAQSVPLVTLTGTDGSGKSMICRMVEWDLREDHQVIFFEQGVESFDQVIEGISNYVGIDQDDKTGARNLHLNRIVEKLKIEKRRLIVIIDGAESIFLATLERIRSMVDLANAEETTIQLLLSGQPLFLLNFKQLGIVSFQDIEERNYSLDPLDVETTYQYLNHCIEIAAGESNDFFSPRMADRIMDTARGNLRLINRLADRYVTSGSLMDPEEDGFDATEMDEPVISVEDSGKISAPSRLGNVDLDFLKVPRLTYQWYVVAGGVIGLLLALFLFFGGDEPTEPVPEIEKVPDLTLDEVEPDPIEIPQAVEQRKPAVVIEQPMPIAEPVEESVEETPQKTEQTVTLQSQVPEVESIEEGASSVSISESETAEAVVSATQEIEIEAETAEAPVTEPVETTVPEVPSTPEVKTVPPDLAGSEGQEQETPDEQVVEPVVEGQQEKTDQGNVDRETVDLQERGESVIADQTSPEIVEKPEIFLEEIAVQRDVLEDVSSEVPGTVSADGALEFKDTETITEIETTGTDSIETTEIEKVPDPLQLSQNPKIDQEVVTSEPIQIPELTVVTKKKQRTETVPFTVVTLKDELKNPPEIKAPAQAPKPVLQSKPVVGTDEQQQQQQPAAIPESEKPKPVDAPAASQADLLALRKPPVPPVVPPVEPIPVRKPPVTAPPAVLQSSLTGKPQNTRAYYAERLAAGSRWLVGGGSGKYTVQLMVLQSDEAETNLGQILNENDYQSIKNKTYILRKAGQLQTTTLYFGEFDSQEEARQAQNQLPQFLKDMNPFAVSVNEAVNKARTSQ